MHDPDSERGREAGAWGARVPHDDRLDAVEGELRGFEVELRLLCLGLELGPGPGS